MKPNILFTSAGRRSYIIDYFKESGKYNKVFAANSYYTIALQIADDYVITPLIYSDNYISFLIDFCKSHDVNLVLSLFDIDCYMLAQHKQEFDEAGICLVGGDADFVKVCNDKYLTSKWVEQIGIGSPKTFLSIADTEAAIERHEIDYPIIIKPRWGMGSIGIYVVDDKEELRMLVNKSIKKINNSFLKYESSLTPDEQLVFQEYVQEQEYGLNIVNDLDGNYITTYATPKIEMRSGETFMGKVVDNDIIRKVGQIIGTHSKHKGILSLDLFLSPEGEVRVTDMNCRIAGTYPIIHLAGFDFPKLLADMYVNDKVNNEYLNVKYEQIVIKDLTPKVLNIPQ